MNDFINKSSAINQQFDCTYINISTSESLLDVGKFKLKKIYAFVQLIFNIFIYLNKNRPDLVYITLSPHGNAFYKDAIIALLSKLFCKNIVFHLHGKGILKNVQLKIKEKIYRYTFKGAHVIHLSKLLEFDLEPIFDNQRASIHFLPNGIPNRVQTLSANIADKEVIKIIYLSNLIPTKGALLAIKAVHNLILMGIYNIHIDLIGKASNNVYYESLRQYVDTNSISDFVTFHNGKYGDDKIAALLDSSIFILPTENDCFPISIIEAMMCGLPIVSTREGAIPELVIENNCGLLSAPNDINSLTNNLKQIILNKELRLKYSQNARQAFLSKYTFEKFESSFIQIMKKLTVYYERY